MKWTFNKRLLWLLLTIFYSGVGFSQSSNFVTLNGDQFKLGGQDFYPVAMNYIVDIVHDNQGNFHIAPHHSYFASNHFECQNAQECYDEIVDDLITMKNMGFNSIRLVGLGFGSVQDANGVFTTYPAFRSKDILNNALITPITSGNYTNMFNFIQTALDAAEDADMKVQLLVGGKKIDDMAFRAPYLNFLQAVSAQFASNSTLYSYDFLNEPLYFDNGNYSKGDVCALVEDWNDAIKDNSSNHLTTLGLATSSEVREWDPGVLKLDFLSFHLYSNNVDEVKSEIKWIAETSRLPWMIGETGYAASTSGVGGQGTLQDQRDFARETLEMTRDCGGSGYSWWMYQDVYWGSPAMGDYLGLVDHANVMKPAGLEFMAFDPTIQGACTTPANYYNFHGYSAYSISGIVKDQNNQPIKNAVINGWDANWNNGGSTFTQANGTFTLYANAPIAKLFASATAASNYENHNASGYQTIALTQFQPTENLTLSGITIATGQAVYYDASNSITSTTVVVQGNGSTGGDCVMNGSQIVRLNTGFSAQKGSHFHAFNDPIYVNCNYVSNNLKISEEVYNGPPPAIPMKPEMPFPPLDISQNALTEALIRIYPNPSMGIFNVVYDGEGSINKIEVINGVGQTILSTSPFQKQESIDLSDKDDGIYILRIYSAEKVHSKMIIKK